MKKLDENVMFDEVVEYFNKEGVKIPYHKLPTLIEDLYYEYKLNGSSSTLWDGYSGVNWDYDDEF